MSKDFRARDTWLPNHPKLPWDCPDVLGTGESKEGNGEPVPAGDTGSCAQKERVRYFTLSCIDQFERVRSWLAEGPAALDEHPRLLLEVNQCFFRDLLGSRCWSPAVHMYRFGDEAELCRDLLRCLFRPSSALDQALARYVQCFDSRPFIGMQIRTLWNWQDGGGAMQQEDFERFFACVEQLLNRGAKGLFVSADDVRAIEEVRRRFPDVETVALPNRILHVDRSEWETFDDYLATFLNVHLLSRCRHLIISHWSNLGRIAALLADERPWITRKATSPPNAPAIGAPGYREADPVELLSKETML